MEADDLKKPHEKFADARRQMDEMFRVRRGATYVSIGGAILVFFFLTIFVGTEGENNFIIFFIVAVIIGIAASAFYVWAATKIYDRKSTPIKTFIENVKPKTGAAAETVTRSLPRLKNLRVLSDADVLNADLDERLNPAAIRGGKIDRDEPAFGVFVPTVTGLAFLPDLDLPAIKMIKESAPVIWGIAKEFLPLPELVQIRDMAADFAAEPEKAMELPEWAEKSVTKPDHFVIPWPELVEVSVDPKSRVATLTRELPDGTRKQNMLATGDPDLPDALFRRRVHFEFVEVVRQKLFEPKRMELLPKVAREFELTHGDRLKEHMDEVEKETSKRALALLASITTADLVALMREEQPVMFEGGPDSLYFVYLSEALMEFSDSGAPGTTN